VACFCNNWKFYYPLPHSQNFGRVFQECALRRVWFCITGINVFPTKITVERLLGGRSVRLTLYEILVIQSNFVRAVKTLMYIIYGSLVGSLRPLITFEYNFRWNQSCRKSELEYDVHLKNYWTYWQTFSSFGMFTLLDCVTNFDDHEITS
jgi:hypothetical protein